jgi:hypothetical protein
LNALTALQHFDRFKLRTFQEESPQQLNETVGAIFGVMRKLAVDLPVMK